MNHHLLGPIQFSLTIVHNDKEVMPAFPVIVGVQAIHSGNVQPNGSMHNVLVQTAFQFPLGITSTQMEFKSQMQVLCRHFLVHLQFKLHLEATCNSMDFKCLVETTLNPFRL